MADLSFDDLIPALKSKATRGERNFNPGNIEDGDFARSLPGYAGSDGRFAKFDSMENGYNAIESLLGSYGRKGINTASGVINRWAPKEDGNPVSQYSAFVGEGDPNAPLDLSSPDVRRRVAERIAQFENGKAIPRGGKSEAQAAPKADLSFDDLIPQEGSLAARFEGDKSNQGLKQLDKMPQKKFGLEDTWPAKLAKSLYEAVTLPGDVAQGKFVVQPEKPGWITEGDIFNQDAADREIIHRSFDLAGIASPGSVATKAAAPAASVETAKPALSGGQEVALAADRLSKTASPVDVPRAISSDSMATQRSGQAIRNIPVVGDAIPRATNKLTGQLEEAAGTVAGQYGAGSGPNVAHRIGQTLSEAAQAERTAATSAAQQADAAVLASWENAHRSAAESIVQREGAALARSRQTLGDMSPQDMGEVLTARLRAGEQEARATKERLYGLAGETEAAIGADTVGQVRGRVAQALEDNGRVIDGTLTPASSRMLDELQRLSTLNIENRAVGARPPASGNEAIAAVSMRGIEQTRKRLNAMSQAATNDADRSAARMIIREFDNWLGDAFDNALFSGSEDALQAFRAARAANTEWRQRYGFNMRDDADRVINRIVTGEVTPQEVANYVIGATKVGSKGVSSRLLTRITEATGGDPEAIGAIRAGVWNRLSQGTEGASARAPERVASDINEFLNGSGRDVARRLFTEPQQSIMRSYAQTLRTGIEARQVISDVAANTRPGATEVGIGPFQRLANEVLGKGGRADEALFEAINSYAKSGSRGDIDLLSRVLKAIPEKDRGDLAAAIVRQIGISPRTKQFSPDVFVSAWSNYTPQAKAMLFGMSGPQRLALDDIAKISLRMKEIGNRFGNPSGTAQNVNYFALATTVLGAGAALFSGDIVTPLTVVSGIIGGAATAKILSSPVGASSIAKWARVYEAAAEKPTPARVEAYKRASTLLAVNISQSSGMNLRTVLSGLQGPVPAGAKDEQE